MIRHAANGGLLSAITLFGLGLAGCGGDDLVLPSEGEPASIALLQGDGQSGRVGEVLPQPVVAQVTDLTGRPVAGASVVFELSGSQPDTAITDNDGMAGGQPILGPSVGETNGAARVIVQEGQAPVEAGFRIIALPSSANGISLVSGDGQSAPANTALPAPLVVGITDAFGNPVAGATVQWTAVEGGSVSAPSTTTDDQGHASVLRTLGGTAGLQTTQASAEGLAGSPVVFSHTATAGTAAVVRIISGDQQNGAAGSQLPADFVVEVVDAGGNPVPAAPITWTVTAGGGSVNPPSGTTDGTGRAAARLTLGPAAGTNTVDAVSGGGGVTFTATATAGAAAALAMQTQPSATATIGVPFSRQPVIQLKDASGNDAAQAGVAVIAAIASGSGQLTGTTTRNTDANGRASFTDLAIAGAGGTHTLIFAASGFTSVTSSAIAVGTATTTTTITSDAPDPSTAGQAVTVQFTVTSSGGTPSGAVQVTASGGTETCSAAVSAGSCGITLTITGSRTLTASYSGDASFEPSSDTESHEVQAANSPPTVQDDGYTAPASQQLSIASPGVLANDSDPDGNGLTAEQLTTPANGAAPLQPDGSFTYTPNAGFIGEDSFTYRASDGSTTSGAATVRITVQ